jgi:hypothetical protein
MRHHGNGNLEESPHIGNPRRNQLLLLLRRRQPLEIYRNHHLAAAALLFRCRRREVVGSKNLAISKELALSRFPEIYIKLTIYYHTILDFLLIIISYSLFNQPSHFMQ